MAKQVATPAPNAVSHATAGRTAAIATPLGTTTTTPHTTSGHDRVAVSSSAPSVDSGHDRPVVAVSFLKPRVAAALGVPQRWHPLLSACRLLTIGPSLWWGVRLALRFLITELVDFSDPSTPKLADLRADAGASLRLIESSLVFVWV